MCAEVAGGSHPVANSRCLCLVVDGDVILHPVVNSRCLCLVDNGNVILHPVANSRCLCLVANGNVILRFVTVCTGVLTGFCLVLPGLPVYLLGNDSYGSVLDGIGVQHKHELPVGLCVCPVLSEDRAD